MVLGPGSRLDQYELLAVLGTGGMGEVYKGRDLRLDRLVAVKVITSARGLDAESRERFEREARSLAALSHPNICQIFQYGDVEGAPFLVMEYLEGETVTQRLRARGRLPLADVLRHGMELAAALEVAHQAGIVHRDLKPDNIILTASALKLLDFGIAKRMVNVADASFGGTTRATLTGLGVISGTLTYMAPEQLEGRPVDVRSDIFSFGAVLYEMATGRRAFEGGSQAAIIASIMTGVPPRASTLESSVPPQLDALLDRCLQKRPADRFRDVSEVRDALHGIPTPPAFVNHAVEAEERRAVRKRKRRRILISFSISISFLFLAVVFILPQMGRRADSANQSVMLVPAPSTSTSPPVPAGAPEPVPVPPSTAAQASGKITQVAAAARGEAARQRLQQAVKESSQTAAEPVNQVSVPRPTPDSGPAPAAAAAPPPALPTGPASYPPSGVLASQAAGSMSPEAHAKREIERLVKDYCAAMETLQTERLSSLYPQVDVARHRELFRQYRSLKCTVVGALEYERLDASATGGAAEVKVRIAQQIQMTTGGNPRAIETVATFAVSRQSIQSPWLIDRVQHTPAPK